ncbi:MAG: universal stress protein [Halothiobacillaceae bacterium]
MYKKILVPVDLAHVDSLTRALDVAADLARHYQAELCYAGVTTSQPGSVARTPEEYRLKLEAFAAHHAAGQERPECRVYVSHDPVADLNEHLLRAIHESGADLVVMGTHLPHHIDAIMPANGSKVAAQSDVSVFLVRP